MNKMQSCHYPEKYNSNVFTVGGKIRPYFYRKIKREKSDLSATQAWIKTGFRKYFSAHRDLTRVPPKHSPTDIIGLLIHVGTATFQARRGRSSARGAMRADAAVGCPVARQPPCGAHWGAPTEAAAGPAP